MVSDGGKLRGIVFSKLDGRHESTTIRMMCIISYDVVLHYNIINKRTSSMSNKKKEEDEHQRKYLIDVHLRTIDFHWFHNTLNGHWRTIDIHDSAHFMFPGLHFAPCHLPIDSLLGLG